MGVSWLAALPLYLAHSAVLRCSIVFKISLGGNGARAILPHTDLLEWADGQLSITLNLGNFLQLTDDPLYFEAYLAIVTNCRYFHNLPPAAGLPAGVGGGAQQALHAQYPAAAGDPALRTSF